MEAKDLKAIIEQVLQEMNVSSDEKAAPEATAAPAPAAECKDGISLRFRKKALNWSLLLLRTAAFRISQKSISVPSIW